MQLPKYSPIELLYTDCGRASGATFIFNNEIYMLTGLEINGEELTLDDIERIHPTDNMRPVAVPFILDASSWGDTEVLDYDAITALCDFVPPAGMFSPTMLPGRVATLRRYRSYSPFISRLTMRWYMPLARDSRILWHDAIADSVSIAKCMASALYGVDLTETTDEQRIDNLVASGYGCVLSDKNTTLVGGSDTYRVHVFSDPSCRSRVMTLTRTPSQRRLTVGDVFNDEAANAAMALMPARFFKGGS
jgi:hypothetical protein